MRLPSANFRMRASVIANGLGLVRVGDQIEPHGCYNNDPAKRVLASSSRLKITNSVSLPENNTAPSDNCLEPTSNPRSGVRTSIYHLCG